MANVPAAAACIALLKLLAPHAEPMPAAALSRVLAVPRSTVYHLLALLRDEGFVVHLESEQRYALGLAAFDLGSAYNRQAPLQLRALYPTRESLIERHGGGPTTLAELRRALAGVRRDGYSSETGLVSA